MADAGVANNGLKYSTWPPYSGYGDWYICTPENNTPGTGTHTPFGDYHINKDQLPASQYAVRYNPFSNEINVTAWAGTVGTPAMWLANTGWIGFGTIQASYNYWLTTGRAGYWDITGSALNDSRTQIGIVAPTFDYQLMDQFKETVHYGFTGTFLVYIMSTGIVEIISMNSFIGYLEHVARSRFKSFRLNNGNISSISYVSGKGTIGDYTYRISSTLRNDIVRSLDVSNDNILMNLYKRKTDGSFYDIQSGIKVKEITGTSILVEAPPPANISLDVPEGWLNGYFEFDKSIIVNNPNILFGERKVSSSNINNNLYLKETSLGYETWEQQVNTNGNIHGVYISRSSYVSYLNALIELKTIYLNEVMEDTNLTDTQKNDIKIATETEIESLNKDIEFLNSADAEIIEDEDMVYGSFDEGVWGMRFLDFLIVKESTSITLNIGIGGGATQKNNMHAGCLSGEFIYQKNTTENNNTYRIVSQIRKDIFQIEIENKTNLSDLLTLMKSQTSITSLIFNVDSSRMWFYNDIVFNSTDIGSCDQAYFWGSLDEQIFEESSSFVNLKIESGYWIYSKPIELYNRFIQDITPTSSFLVKKWINTDGWCLNNQSGTLSVKIKSILYIPETEIFKIELDTIEPIEISGNWWISFDDKYNISGGYNYIYTPTLEMEASITTGNDNTSGKADTVLLNGIYVGLPLREKLFEKSILTIVMENGGVYPSVNSSAYVYLSTIMKGNVINFCRNQYTNMKNLLYTRSDDASKALIVRKGAINFIHDITESIVYYGDQKTEEIPFTGSAGNDISLDLSQYASNYYLKSFKVLPDTYPINSFVVWAMYHGNFLLSYPSTSGKISSILTRKDNNLYKEEESEIYPFYFSGSLKGSKTKYDLLVNTQSKSNNVGNNSLLKISPIYNETASPYMTNVFGDWVNSNNVIKNAGDPYIYNFNNYMDHILFTKNQGFIISENSTNISLASTEIIRNETSGKFTYPIKEMHKIVDPSQSGVFLISTKNDFDSFNSGDYEKKSSSLVDNISLITVLDENNLYAFPHLLIPNIKRCSYDGNKSTLSIVGFSNISDSSSSYNHSVLALTYHNINVLDLKRFIITGIKDSSNKYIATFCDIPFKNYSIVTAQKPCYFYNSTDDVKFIDSSLSVAAISLAVDENIILILVQKSSGFVYFLSTDAGSTWCYFDDVSLINSSFGSVSSPSIKIYNDEIWIFYINNSSDLYLKKIYLAKLVSLCSYTRNKKSSGVQDLSYINLKINLQDYLDNACPSYFVNQINDQQVTFDIEKNNIIHVIYQDARGNIKSASSTDGGIKWNLTPINF